MVVPADDDDEWSHSENALTADQLVLYEQEPYPYQML
jgi:hypothetical protein